MAKGFTHSNGSGSTPIIDSIWCPHWGVSQETMESYATSGKIAFLIKSDVNFYCTINTSTGQYRATIKGKSGADKVVDTNDNVQYVFDCTAVDLPVPFDDSDNINGYTTYILVLELLTGGATITAFNITGFSGHLWCIWNNSHAGTTYMFDTSGTGDYSLFFEAIKFLSGGLTRYSITPLKAIRYIEGASYANNVAFDYFAQNCNAIIYVNNNFAGSNYTSSYESCYLIDNNVSGTYPNATTMNACFRLNYSRSKQMIIVAPNLTNFSNNYSMYWLPELSITAPLTAIDIRNAYNLKILTLTNTNFKSLGSTTNAIQINGLSSISATEITNFLTALEDLTGYTAQNILKTGVTNWNAGHTTAANAKNWNVV